MTKSTNKKHATKKINVEYPLNSGRYPMTPSTEPSMPVEKKNPKNDTILF
jgi:hypothetical protein